MKPQKLKRSVIKEELVLLTGNGSRAIALQQLLYWSERTREFDEFIKEETARSGLSDTQNVPLTFGWIYKSAKELSDELMLGWSDDFTRDQLKFLVEAGLVAQRRHPTNPMNRVLQYRPDIVAIQKRLNMLGYALEGYPLVIQLDEDVIIPPTELSKTPTAFSETPQAFSQHAESPYFFEGKSPKNAPEITTEITINTSTPPIAESAKEITGEIEFVTPEPAPKRTPEEAKASVTAALSNPDIGTRSAVADGHGEQQANRELLAAGIAVACGYASANKDCYAATKKLLADMPRWQTGAKVSVMDISEYLIRRGQQEKRLGSPYFAPSDIRDYFAKRKPDDVKAAKGNNAAGLSIVEPLSNEQIRKNQDEYVSANADYLAEWKSKRKRNRPVGPALSD